MGATNEADPITMAFVIVGCFGSYQNMKSIISLSEPYNQQNPTKNKVADNRDTTVAM